MLKAMAQSSCAQWTTQGALLGTKHSVRTSMSWTPCVKSKQQMLGTRSLHGIDKRLSLMVKYRPTRSAHTPPLKASNLPTSVGSKTKLMGMSWCVLQNGATHIYRLITSNLCVHHIQHS